MTESELQQQRLTKWHLDGQSVRTIEAAREFGFKVIGTACLVEREEAGGRAAVEKAAAPAPFISIFKAGEVKAAHLNRRNR